MPGPRRRQRWWPALRQRSPGPCLGQRRLRPPRPPPPRCPRRMPRRRTSHRGRSLHPLPRPDVIPTRRVLPGRPPRWPRLWRSPSRRSRCRRAPGPRYQRRPPHRPRRRRALPHRRRPRHPRLPRRHRHRHRRRRRHRRNPDRSCACASWLSASACRPSVVRPRACRRGSGPARRAGGTCRYRVVRVPGGTAGFGSGQVGKRSLGGYGEPVFHPADDPFPHVTPPITAKHGHLPKSEDWEERTNTVTVRQ
jgi:hypothetical protein